MRIDELDSPGNSKLQGWIGFIKFCWFQIWHKHDLEFVKPLNEEDLNKYKCRECGVNVYKHD